MEGIRIEPLPEPQPVNVRSLVGELRQNLEEERQAQFSRYGPQVMAWLALPPVWSEEAAHRAKFPLKEKLEDFLTNAAAQGLIVRHLPQQTGADHARGRALAALARCALPPELIPQIMKRIWMLADPADQVEGLLALLAAHGSQLPVDVWLECWNKALEVENLDDRGQVLLSLVEAAPGRVASHLAGTLAYLVLVAMGAMEFENQIGEALQGDVPDLLAILADDRRKLQTGESQKSFDAWFSGLQAGFASLRDRLDEAVAGLQTADRSSLAKVIMERGGGLRGDEEVRRRLADYIFQPGDPLQKARLLLLQAGYASTSQAQAQARQALALVQQAAEKPDQAASACSLLPALAKFLPSREVLPVALGLANGADLRRKVSFAAATLETYTLTPGQVEIAEIASVLDWALGLGDEATRQPALTALLKASIPPNCIALREDGRVVVTGYDDGTLRFWDLGGRRLLWVIHAHSAAVRCLAIRPDGGIIVSGADDHAITAWNPESGQLVFSMTDHQGPVRSLAFTPEGDQLVSGSDDHTVKIWDLKNRRLLDTLTFHESGVSSVALSADGRVGLSGSQDGIIQVWEAKSGRLSRTIKDHEGEVTYLTTSSDGRLAASGSRDGTIRVFDTWNGNRLWSFEDQKGDVTGVVLSSDGRTLVSGSSDGELKVRTLGKFTEYSLQDPQVGVRGLAMSGDARKVAYITKTGSLRLWDIQTQGRENSSLPVDSLPGVVASRLLELAGQMDRASNQAQVLTRLAPALDQEQASIALRLAQNLPDPNARAAALAGLASWLPDGPRRASLQGLLEAARTIQDPVARAFALSDMLPSLPSELQVDVLDQALESAAMVGEASRAALALGNLARRLGLLGGAQPADTDGPAMASADMQRLRILIGNLQDPGAQVTALVRVIAPAEGTAQQDARAQALECLAQIEQPSGRLKAAQELLPYLDPDKARTVAVQALADAAGLEDLEEAGRSLAALVPVIPTEWLPSALEAIDGFRPLRLFSMPGSLRSEILKDLQKSSGLSFLMGAARQIGSRLSDRPPGLPLPEDLRRWVELTSRFDEYTSRAAAWLGQRLHALAAAGDTASMLAWLKIVQPLAEVLGGDLEALLLIGNHRLELAYRKRQDERRLEHFLARQDQIQVFRDLIEGSPDAPWVLHFLGLGGVGKTMLLRYITRRLAPEAGMLTARVDFDHLDPDYPVRKPAQLLIEFAQELRLDSDDRAAESYYTTLENTVIFLHEQFSGDVSPPSTLDLIDGPEFLSAIVQFVDFLRALRKPVMLILDTTEELAKAQIARREATNILATFKILGKIHEVLPEIKVVLAGRRLVALSGYNYAMRTLAGKPPEKALSAPEALHTWVTQLPEESYPEAKRYLPRSLPSLRLYEIRGFTRDEALTYLTEICGLRRPDDLLEAMLEASLELGDSAQIDWLAAPGASPAAEVGAENPSTDPSLAVLRYNPFDLAAFAELAMEEPGLTPADLRRAPGKDPYIEIRLLRRLRQQELVRLMPAVVILRRFDRNMLRGFLRLPRPVFEDLFRELGDQEWVDYQPVQELNTTFLEVDSHLYPRLWEYYQAGEYNSQLDDTRRKLGRRMLALFRLCPLNQLDATHYNAALECLPPLKGAILWEKVIQRVPDQASWERLENVTDSLLAQPEEIIYLPDDPTVETNLYENDRITARIVTSLKDVNTFIIPVTSSNKADIFRLWDIEDAHRRHIEQTTRSWLRRTNMRTIDQGAVASADHPLWPAVTAALLSARLHVPGAALEPEVWAQVEARAGNHPIAAVAEWLRERGVLAQMADLWRNGWPQGRPFTGRVGELVGKIINQLQREYEDLGKAVEQEGDRKLDVTDIASEFRGQLVGQPLGPLALEDVVRSSPKEASPAGRYRFEQLTAARLAVIDAWLDWRETVSDMWLLQDAMPVAHLLEEWAAHLKELDSSLELICFAHLLAGRTMALESRYLDARANFDLAGQLPFDSDPKRWPAQKWADWLPPASLVCRARLEALRLPASEHPPADKLGEWQDYAETQLWTIDGERLLARIVELRLGEGLLPLAELERLRKLDVYDPLRRPNAPVHRSVRPLFAVLAQGLAALGRGELAATWVNERVNQALTSANDPDTVEAGKRVLLEITRRFRWPDRFPEITAEFGDTRGSLRRTLEGVGRNLAGNENPLLQLAGIALSALTVERENSANQAFAWQVAALCKGKHNGRRPETPYPDWSAERLHAWWSSLEIGIGPTIADGTTPQSVSQYYSIVQERLSSRAPFDLERTDIAETFLEYDFFETQILSSISRQREAVTNSQLLADPLGPAVLKADLESASRLWLRAWALRFPEDYADRPPLNFVNPLYIAELAIEEGELLALRLPAKAIRLLEEQAANRFDEVHDYLRAVWAITLAAGAAVRAKQPELARRLLERLAGLYGELVTSEPGLNLPAWEILGAWAAAPDRLQEYLAKDIPREWHGWVARWLALKVWEHEPEGWGSLTAGLQRELRQLFEGELPLELRLGSPPQLEVAQATVSVQPSGCLPKIVQRLMNYLLPDFSLAEAASSTLSKSLSGLWTSMNRSPILRFVKVIGLAWLIEIVLFNTSAGTLLSPAPGPGWVVRAVTIAGLAGILYLIGYLWHRLTESMDHALKRRERFWLHLQAEGTWIQRSSRQPPLTQLHLEAELPWIRRVWPFNRRSVLPIETNGTVPGFGPYQNANLTSSAAMIAALRNLQAELGDRQAPLYLSASPAVSGDPWEAAIALNIRPGPQPGRWQETFQVVRIPERYVVESGDKISGSVKVGNIVVDIGSVRKQNRDARSLRASGPVLAVTGPTWRQLVEQGWSKLPEFTFAGEENPLESVRRARLLHLMGRCTLTTAGLRLQVSGTGTTILSKTAGDSARHGLLLNSAEINKGTYGLVVVQGDPNPPESVRFDSERQDTGILRAFAAEIFSGVAPAVLLLPSLPPDLAASLLEMIANEFNLRSSGRWNTWERPQDDPLINLASRLRQRIAEWRPGTDSGQQTEAAFSQAEMPIQSDVGTGPGATRGLPAVMLEKALDLTLFLRDEGDFF